MSATKAQESSFLPPWQMTLFLSRNRFFGEHGRMGRMLYVLASLDCAAVFMLLLLTNPWKMRLRAWGPGLACLDCVNRDMKVLVWLQAVCLYTSFKMEPEANCGLLHSAPMHITLRVQQPAQQHFLVTRPFPVFLMFRGCIWECVCMRGSSCFIWQMTPQMQSILELGRSSRLLI